MCKAPPVPSHHAVDAPAPPLRVAVDATPLLGATPTGVGAFCAGLLAGLATRPGLAVSAFAVSWRRRRALTPALPTGVTARQRPMPARPLHALWRRSDRPRLEWFVGSTDVVHGTNFVVPPTGAASVLTVHDLAVIRFPELCDPATLVFPELIRRALRRGAWIHTPSAFVAGEVVELLGADPERVRAVHSGTPATRVGAKVAAGGGGAGPPRHAALRAGTIVGPAARTTERPPVLPPGATRFVLSVGTAEPRKDLPGLVRAFDLVAADHPDVALVLAGPSGWGADQLNTAVRTARFGERIVRTGWLDDAALDALRRSATLLAFPSVYEGFGFPPLEAMAAGVPVVATAAGALPEVLGDAAELVPVGDADALAAAMARLLDSADLRATMAARGLDRAAGFTWEACAAGLADLYHDAVREHGG